MKLSKETILSYQEFIEKKYGQKLSIEECEEKSRLILNFMNRFYKKIPK